MEFHLALLLLVPLFCGSDAGAVDNQFCEAHPTLVPIDHPTYGYFPYFIKLHRCGGSCQLIQPSIKSCVATETKNVTVGIFEMNKNRQRKIQLVNHTKCGCQCVAKPSECTGLQLWKPERCSCVCKYTHKPPPSPCPEGHRWDSDHCGCVCDKPPEVCPVGKHWSSRACGCVCRSEIERTCRSKGMVTDDYCECKAIDLGATKEKNPKEFKINKLMLVLMIGEFALMFLVFDAILYHKKAGLMHSVVTRLRCKGQTKDEVEKQSDIRNSYEVSSVSTKEDFVENV